MKTKLSNQINLRQTDYNGANAQNPLIKLLLGNGSLCWLIVICIIPVLFNLNVQEYYTQVMELNHSTSKVQGTVLHSLYARDTFNYGTFSEVVEIHYHYQFNNKNFTGWSYTTDWYYPYGRKLTVLVSNKNPKVSRLAVASYLECDESIINLLILMLGLLLGGIYKYLYTPSKLKYMSLTKSLGLITLFRITPVAVSIYISLHYSIRDIVFDLFLPVSVNALILFCLITTAIWNYSLAQKK